MSAITSERRSTVASRLLSQVGQIDRRLVWVIACWFVALWLLAWLAVSMATNNPAYAGPPAALHFTPEQEPLWQYIWARWDGQWYISIAYGGYDYTQFGYPFFPLYPMLIAAGQAITHLPFAGAGILVSYVCLPLGLVYLYKLCRLDFGHELTVRSIITLLLYPTAFFFLAVYTESLVLFLVTAALYYARTDRWWLVALLAFAAGLTKVAAVALAVALVLEVVLGRANSLAEWERLSPRDVFSPRKIIARFGPAKIAALLAGPAALLGYMAYLQIRFGDALAFVHVLTVRFYRGRQGFLGEIGYLLGLFIKNGISADDLPKIGDLFAFIFLVATAVYLAVRVRFSYAALIIVFLATVVMSGDTNSLDRYLLTLSPVFIGLAAATRRTPRTWLAIVAGFAALQVFFALRFFLWQWVD